MVVKVRLKDIIAKPEEVIVWNKKQLEMKEEIINNYDIKKGAISISKENKIMNGNHRYWILKNHYGEDHEILVVKHPLKWSYYLAMAYILAIVGSPIWFIIGIYQKYNEHGFRPFKR